MPRKRDRAPAAPSQAEPSSIAPARTSDSAPAADNDDDGEANQRHYRVDGREGGVKRRKKGKLVPDSNWKTIKATLPPPAKPHGGPGKSHKTAAAASASLAPVPAVPAAKPTTAACVALDCEMVGVGASKATALGRVTIVDGEGGHVLFDSHVRPSEPVTDFRTRWSGILPHHLRNAPHINAVRPIVAQLIHSKIVVGHSLKNDFDALGLSMPPKHLLRDTALYKPYRMALPGAKSRPRKLKDLALEKLGMVIQQGQQGHSPIEDAQAALALYIKVKEHWDRRFSVNP